MISRFVAHLFRLRAYVLISHVSAETEKEEYIVILELQNKRRASLHLPSSFLTDLTDFALSSSYSSPSSPMLGY